MPGSNRIILNLPGDQVAVIATLILVELGYSASEIAAAKVRAKNVFNKLFYSGLRRLVFPAVNRRLAVRTGRLKRSFRLVRQRDNAVFGMVHYGQFRVTRPIPNVTVQRAIIQEFVKRGKPMIENALQAALDAV